MKKKIKRGFTIVELVIVIAVIGVLSAILIPTFAGLLNSAREAADIQMVRNLNNALATDEVLNGKRETAYDAIKVANETGYSVEKLTPTAFGCDIVWDRISNRFVIMSGNEVKFSDETTKPSTNRYDMFKIYKREDIPAEQTYSIYLMKTDDTSPVNINGVGIDVGDNTNITEVVYNNNQEDRDVIIRTNNSKTNLRINDSTGKGITLYGTVGKITGTNCINAESDTFDGAVVAPNSLHVNSNTIVSYLKIASGRVVNNGRIDLIYATSEKVMIVNDGNIDHAHADQEFAGALNEKISGSAKIVFDYNNNTEQNSNADVYHHVDESEVVVGNKKADVNFDADKVADSLVAEAEGKVVKVVVNGETTILTLEEFRDEWNKGTYYEQGAEISLIANADISTDGDWAPIGNWAYPFNGTFNGNGYAINGLTSDAIATGGNYTHIFANGNTIGFGETYGFFGIIGGGETIIENITFTNVKVSINQGKNVGAVIGYAPNNSKFKSDGKDFADNKWENDSEIGTHSLTLRNVIVGTADDNSSVYGATHVGGLVGKFYSTGNFSAIGCYNYAEVSSESNASGILCYAYNGRESMTFENCHNYGVINAKNNGVGGIAGFADGTTAIFKSCSNNGVINIESKAYVGGILGIIQSSVTNVTFEDCSNTANLNGDNSTVGGIYAGNYGAATLNAKIYFKGNLVSTGEISGASGVVGNVVGCHGNSGIEITESTTVAELKTFDISELNSDITLVISNYKHWYQLNYPLSIGLAN